MGKSVVDWLTCHGKWKLKISNVHSALLLVDWLTFRKVDKNFTRVRVKSVVDWLTFRKVDTNFTRVRVKSVVDWLTCHGKWKIKISNVHSALLVVDWLNFRKVDKNFTRVRIKSVVDWLTFRKV